MSTEEMGLDDFVNHAPMERRARGPYLKSWKKRKSITTWLHTGGRIIALWRHGWSRVVDTEQNGRQIWGDQFNCWEPGDVLRRQYHREKSTDQRKVPPTTCPICLLTELVRLYVREGRLSWTEPLFQFDGDADQLIYTAGGVYNAFARQDITKEEIAELTRAGIRRDQAFKQNLAAKCNYVFMVVDEDHPEDGVQIAVEGTALGDAVKNVIRDQMDALGDEEGNPLKFPYAIRWEYDEAKDFDDKYRALALPKVVLTEDVHALITGEAPDVTSLIARGNIATLRAHMEEHSLIELPWDEIFGPAEALYDGQQAPAEQAPAPARPAPAPAQRRAVAPAPAARQQPAPAPAARAAAAPVRRAVAAAPTAAPAPAARPAAPAARPAPRPMAARPAPAPARPAAAPAPAARPVARPAPAPAAPARRRVVEPPPAIGPAPPNYPEGTVIVPCEKCQADMADTDVECWNCGARYALEEVAPNGEAASSDNGNDWTDGNEAWGMPPEPVG